MGSPACLWEWCIVKSENQQGWPNLEALAKCVCQTILHPPFVLIQLQHDLHPYGSPSPSAHFTKGSIVGPTAGWSALEDLSTIVTKRTHSFSLNISMNVFRSHLLVGLFSWYLDNVEKFVVTLNFCSLNVHFISRNWFYVKYRIM